MLEMATWSVFSLHKEVKGEIRVPEEYAKQCQEWFYVDGQHTPIEKIIKWLETQIKK